MKECNLMGWVKRETFQWEQVPSHTVCDSSSIGAAKLQRDEEKNIVGACPSVSQDSVSVGELEPIFLKDEIQSESPTLVCSHWNVKLAAPQTMNGSLTSPEP